MRCMACQDPKLEGSLGQLAWSWYAPRKHLSLHVGLDFHSLARWFFLHSDSLMCKGRMSCGETATKGVGSECAFPHALCVPVQPALGPRKKALIQEIKHGHNLYKSTYTSCMTEFSYISFNPGLFLSTVHKCSFAERGTKSIFTQSCTTENSHSMNIKCLWGVQNIPRVKNQV